MTNLTIVLTAAIIPVVAATIALWVLARAP